MGNFKINPITAKMDLVQDNSELATYDARYLKLSGSLAEVSTHSHTVLSDIGTNTHAQIDTHIGSSSNPHTTTLEQARTAGAILAGNITFSGEDSWRSIYGSSATTNNYTGTNINLESGNGLGSGRGGIFQFKVGDGGETGNGGWATFTAGNGGTTSGNGGGIFFNAGNAQVQGDGGGIEFFAGIGAGTGSPGTYRFYETITAGYIGILDFNSITADRTYTFPDATGTLALTSDIISDHTLLSNIGTNTHAQIDTHIGAANPHSGSAASGANSDITSLSGLTTPLSIAQGGTANTQGSAALNTNRFMIGATDFTGVGGSNMALPTWVLGLINSGTAQLGTGTANHPGSVAPTSSTTANSGAYYFTNTAAFLLAGGETTELIFKPKDVSANTTVKFGFMDTASITVPVDGVWINIAADTLDGRTSSNSVSSTTSTSYTIANETWYRVKIVLNSDATLATFTLYSEAGATLWTNTLSTNIPTATGRETGHGVLATNAETTATALVNLDYMSLYIDRNLTR